MGNLWETYGKLEGRGRRLFSIEHDLGKLRNKRLGIAKGNGWELHFSALHPWASGSLGLGALDLGPRGRWASGTLGHRGPRPLGLAHGDRGPRGPWASKTLDLKGSWASENLGFRESPMGAGGWGGGDGHTHTHTHTYTHTHTHTHTHTRKTE